MLLVAPIHYTQHTELCQVMSLILALQQVVVAD